MRKCAKCCSSIENKRADAIFCSKKCKKEHWHRLRYPTPAIRLSDEERRAKRIAYKKYWQSANKERHLANMRKYCTERYSTDIDYRLTVNLRNRLNTAIKGKYKAGSAIKYLGCSIEQLKEHLESKFLPGMTWDNKGKYGWHIDHIIPLSKFILTDPVQLALACHYSNLQPMWAKDNIKKSNKSG